MASNNGTLSVEVNLKSVANKFWNCIKDSTIIFPKVLSKYYKSIEVLEGDGKAVGSIRFITYNSGSWLKERIEAVDEEKKTVSYSVIEGSVLKDYKSFKGHIVVSPKEDGNGSLVKWSCEFEKASEEMPDPHVIKEYVVKHFSELDDYVLKLQA